MQNRLDALLKQIARGSEYFLIAAMRVSQQNIKENQVHVEIKINQIFHYTVLAELVQSILSVSRAHFRIIASGQHSSFRRNVAAKRAVGNTMFDLTVRDLNLRLPTPETNANTARPKTLKMTFELKIFYSVNA